MADRETFHHKTGTNNPVNNDTITPIAFEPAGNRPTSVRRKLPVASLILALLLTVILTSLWFVFTARSLTLELTPAQASSEISGGFVLALADHILLRPGNYRIVASAPGYHDLSLEVDVGEEREQRIEMALEKKPGLLAITTDPPGARILLDNRDRGETPQTLADLPAGTYQIELNHPRHKPWRSELSLPGMAITEQLTVTLEPAWGLINLTSEPAGAEVSVDGRPVGVTPLAAQVLESGETVALKLAGHRRWEQVLHGVPGQTLEQPTITLAPADGLATITSTPAGATVTVNDQYRGRTPLEMELEPDRDQRIVLVLEGYHSEEQSLRLSAGEEQEVDIPLRPILGTLSVSATPAGATLLVDGQRREAGDLSLPTRPHRIEARLKGHVTEIRTVTPRPGMEQRVHFDLRPDTPVGPAAPATQITTGAGQQLLMFSPGGSFTLGSSRREQGRRANEVQRQVAFERPFYLATTEVTNSQFKQFRVTHSSSHFNRNTLDLPDQPVVRVSWEDAARYCNWLSAKDGLPPFYQESGGKITGHNPTATGYRLASEAEWEWAARADNAGAMRRFPWGNDFPPPTTTLAIANYADTSAADVLGRVVAGYRDGHIVSAPVKKFPANDKGLYGIGHNVAEWVHDYYGIETTLGTRPQVDTLGPENGEFRVIRGASWRHGTLTELRLSFRDYGSDLRDDVGFRIARYAR